MNKKKGEEGAHLRISDNIEKSDDIRAASEILKNLDLTLDLLLLDRLQNLDDAFLVVNDVDAFENFRILSAAC